MIAPRSISLLQPPLPHNYGSCHFFFPTVPLSVFVFPPTASPDLQGSALALQETCWQRGRSWFLQLQLPNADSPCCQSDTLCLAFPRSWSSTALRLYHGARHTHTRTHTHEHAHLIRLRAAFPASVQQNDHMYGHNHEISRRTQAVIILLGGALFLFMSFFFYCKTQWIGRGGGENRHWRKKTVNVRARA